MKKIIVNGANGKMGSATVNAIKQEKNLELVAQLTRGDNLEKCIQDTNATIVIDFTEPNAVYENTKTIIKNNAHPIIGTTGFKNGEIDELTALCESKKLGGIIAPNFSLGVVLMMQFSQQAAKYFQYADIVEMHHENKKDAPSGTSIKTAELINEIRENKKIACKEQINGALGADCKSTPIHSVRMPGLLAHQQVMFGAPGETLTIRHDCTDRQSFMPGVIFSCNKVMSLNSLIYGLENLLA